MTGGADKRSRKRKRAASEESQTAVETKHLHEDENEKDVQEPDAQETAAGAQEPTVVYAFKKTVYLKDDGHKQDIYVIRRVLPGSLSPGVQYFTILPYKAKGLSVTGTFQPRKKGVVCGPAETLQLTRDNWRHHCFIARHINKDKLLEYDGSRRKACKNGLPEDGARIFPFSINKLYCGDFNLKIENEGETPLQLVFRAKAKADRNSKDILENILSSEDFTKLLNSVHEPGKDKVKEKLYQKAVRERAEIQEGVRRGEDKDVRDKAIQGSELKDRVKQLEEQLKGAGIEPVPAPVKPKQGEGEGASSGPSPPASSSPVANSLPAGEPAEARGSAEGGDPHTSATSSEEGDDSDDVGQQGDGSEDTDEDAPGEEIEGAEEVEGAEEEDADEEDAEEGAEEEGRGGGEGGEGGGSYGREGANGPSSPAPPSSSSPANSQPAGALPNCTSASFSSSPAGTPMIPLDSLWDQSPGPDLGRGLNYGAPIPSLSLQPLTAVPACAVPGGSVEVQGPHPAVQALQTLQALQASLPPAFFQLVRSMLEAFALLAPEEMQVFACNPLPLLPAAVAGPGVDPASEMAQVSLAANADHFGNGLLAHQ
eukprot:tig00021036_g17300.t2